MCPNEFKILANVKDILKNLANDFNFFATDEKYQSKTTFKKLKMLKDKATKEKKISEDSNQKKN